MEAYAPSRALEEIWNLVRGTNRYVDGMAPWTLAKQPDQRAQLEHVVHCFLEAVLWSAYLVWPVMPQKAEAIVALLGVRFSPKWPAHWNQELPKGAIVRKGDPLFPRIAPEDQAQWLDKWLKSTQK